MNPSVAARLCRGHSAVLSVAAILLFPLTERYEVHGSCADGAQLASREENLLLRVARSARQSARERNTNKIDWRQGGR